MTTPTQPSAEEIRVFLKKFNDLDEIVAVALDSPITQENRDICQTVYNCLKSLAEEKDGTL
jgi:hypothetical protein